MLLRLALRNFVIVDQLELEFSSGFGALTGETGAGKSILIDALALSLGERAEAGVVRSGCERADISATFDIQALPACRDWLLANDFELDESLLLRRVVEAAGRSRAYINGSPASVQQLREVGEFLVDIHGQHAHQSLMRADAQRELVDQHAGLTAQVAQVRALHRAWKDAESALSAARSGGEALAREREQLQWQSEELTALGFEAEAWEALQLEHRRLAHAASLIEDTQLALSALEGEAACASLLDTARRRVEKMLEVDPGLASVLAMLDSAQTELKESISSLRRYADRVDIDPARLAEIERRMEAVLSCARKYRVAPEALPTLLAEVNARLDQLAQTADLAVLDARLQAAEHAYLAAATPLSAARQQAARTLGEAVTGQMQRLALSAGRFEIALQPLAVGGAFGLEQLEFRIAGLSSDQARPLARVASGGELSRISLAIQVVTSRSAAVPTLIFDEVDVGIGGGVAEVVGRLLAELGRERQVLSVTHLPQVAARADWQWQVSKSVVDGQVQSRIEPLDGEGRVSEIARMLGGVEITDITRQHARELLG